MGLLKNHPKNTNYHRLAKTLKFFIAKMQCTHDNQEDFTWVIIWAKKVKGGKEWTNNVRQYGAIYLSD